GASCSILPPDCGRSLSAACGQGEALWKRAMSSGRTTRCEPGRFAVRRRPDCGRSLSAACRPAEADCRKSVVLYLSMRCEPGRFAVRRGQCRCARYVWAHLPSDFLELLCVRTTSEACVFPSLCAE